MKVYENYNTIRKLGEIPKFDWLTRLKGQNDPKAITKDKLQRSLIERLCLPVDSKNINTTVFRIPNTFAFYSEIEFVIEYKIDDIDITKIDPIYGIWDDECFIRYGEFMEV